MCPKNKIEVFRDAFRQSRKRFLKYLRVYRCARAWSTGRRRRDSSYHYGLKGKAFPSLRPLVAAFATPSTGAPPP